MEASYAAFAAAITRWQLVRLICKKDWQPHATTLLRKARANFKQIEWVDLPSNDAWTRDHGPLFVHGAAGLEIIDLEYNAWGGKFPPWDLDNAIPSAVAKNKHLPLHRSSIVGEGGALEINSQGTLITTESVWLNANRNPDASKGKIEAAFKTLFGVERTVWLPAGLLGDDTDGHIDTLTRFVDDETVVTVTTDENDPNFPVLEHNRTILEKHFRVVPLPLPDPIQPEGWREEFLPATYANFLILNQAVLVPTYRQHARDEDTLDLLHSLFPGREVLGVDAADLIWEGGALHCLSMQEPA